MARRCYSLKVGNETYKLRLTLAGQKEIKRYAPDAEVSDTIMNAITDPDAMEIVLTQVLSWDGNENATHSGEELYDKIVDAGNGGQVYFAKLLLGIMENAGLMTEDQRVKLERRVTRATAQTDLEDDPDDVEEPDRDPLEALPML